MENKKDSLGQVFTPNEIAKLMSKILLSYEPKEILDPSIGSGELIKYFHESSNDIKITGYDIDEYWIDNLMNKGINVSLQDFLTTSSKFESIIMNPPYIRQERIDITYKKYIIQKLIEETKGELDSISLKSNMYILFLIKALISLKENGVLVAIIPNTWLKSSYGKNIQSYILKGYTIKKIINFNQKIFQGIDVDVSIFEIHNIKPMGNKIAFIDLQGKYEKDYFDNIINLKSEENIKINKINQNEIIINNWDIYKKNILYNNDNLIDLKELFHIERGISTNSNSFFIHDKDDGLVTNYPNYFRPIISKSSDIKNFQVEEEEINKYLMVIKENKDTLPLDILNFITHFEKDMKEDFNNKVLTKKIIKNPETWYIINAKSKNSLIFNYIIRNNPRFIYSTDAFFVKDNFYLLNSDDPDILYLYLVILNTIFTRYSLEHSGRFYGSGLLKIQKYELEDIQVLNHNQLSKKHKNDLLTLSKKIIKTSDTSLMKKYFYEAENILEPYYLTDNSLDDLYDSYFNDSLTRRNSGV